MATLTLPPNLDADRARLLLAIALFQEDGLTVGRAAEIAGIGYREFADALLARRIPLTTYTDEMWEQDLAFLGQRQDERGS